MESHALLLFDKLFVFTAKYFKKKYKSCHGVSIFLYNVPIFHLSPKHWIGPEDITYLVTNVLKRSQFITVCVTSTVVTVRRM